MRDRDGRLALTSPQRRKLLKLAAASGLLAAVERNVALAQSAPDYKALVCIYLAGGNDGENTLIRYDTAGYQQYALVRTLGSGLNVAQGSLQPIQPINLGTPFGFHPACAPLKALFDQQRLAVVANMGVLAGPTTRSALEGSNAPRPANLFSHADQELAMQTADPAALNRIGWGGRIADRLAAASPSTLFPPLISTSGVRPFTTGAQTIPLTVPDSPWFALFSSGDDQYQFDVLRDAALREILSQSRGNVYDDVAQLLAEEGMSASSVMFPILQNTSSIVPPFFEPLNSPVSRQLRTIAMLLEGRAQTQLRRQVFSVHQPGYDTHGGQPGFHQALLSDLSQGLKAFQDAVAALGLSSQVTTFTLSDFGRTFKPAANAGTDHGWGNYAFVAGGAVRGGAFYGTVPTHALDGPDDFGNEGRWIPTTSLEQYGATLARWLGIAEADLTYVFPNLGAFASRNLGFMA